MWFFILKHTKRLLMCINASSLHQLYMVTFTLLLHMIFDCINDIVHFTQPKEDQLHHSKASTVSITHQQVSLFPEKVLLILESFFLVYFSYYKGKTRLQLYVPVMVLTVSYLIRTLYLTTTTMLPKSKLLALMCTIIEQMHGSSIAL